jgi:hypothetical protein
LGSTPGEVTVWDQNFESQFQEPDSDFPHVIRWLEGLAFDPRLEAHTLPERFLAQPASDADIRKLVQALVSLAVRSPMTREALISIPEQLRGPIPERERNMLIALNMRDMYQKATESIGTRGKFVVIYSPDREFIFGDGFHHNIRSPAGMPMGPRILAPMTPRISVLFVRPHMYSTEPRLTTIVTTHEEAEGLNQTIQIYARDEIFYRTERPTICPEFAQGKHLEFADRGNHVDQLIGGIPGVH